VDQTTTGTTNVFGSSGADTADEALADIASRVLRAGDADAVETTIKIRPVGVPAGALPVRVIDLVDVDGVLGLDALHTARVRAALGSAETGPGSVLQLIARFERR
jgi:hypothetical protein